MFSAMKAGIVVSATQFAEAFKMTEDGVCHAVRGRTGH